MSTYGEEGPWESTETFNVACAVQSFEQTVQKCCIISHDSSNILDEKCSPQILPYIKCFGQGFQREHAKSVRERYMA